MHTTVYATFHFSCQLYSSAAGLRIYDAAQKPDGTELAVQALTASAVCTSFQYRFCIHLKKHSFQHTALVSVKGPGGWLLGLGHGTQDLQARTFWAEVSMGLQQQQNPTMLSLRLHEKQQTCFSSYPTLQVKSKVQVLYYLELLTTNEDLSYIFLSLGAAAKCDNLI